MIDTARPMTSAPAWWRRADEAARGLALDLGLYGVSALFAGITAVTSTLAPHRAWGGIAVWGYLAAALATLAALKLPQPIRVRAWLTGLTWTATALVPLVIQAVQRADGRTDRAQEEVLVIEHAAQRLLDHGTPYLDRAAIAEQSEPLLGYVPYQPGMAFLGLPRAVLGYGWATDARVWFAVVTAAVLAAALVLLHRGGTPAGPLIRAAQAATVLPLCALTLATGGDDIPVLALCLLALSFAARDRLGGAGLAIGVAAALKLFAWPVAAVLAVHALRRRQPGRYLIGALGLPVLVLLPALLRDSGAAAENLVAFPLGRGLVSSPAQSPFPGNLIANHLPGGRAVAAVLLVGAALVLAIGLVRRPPDTAASAALWCGYGLLAAILLIPSTRFGYLLYPVALLVWAPALAAARPRVPV